MFDAITKVSKTRNWAATRTSNELVKNYALTDELIKSAATTATTTSQFRHVCDTIWLSVRSAFNGPSTSAHPLFLPRSWIDPECRAHSPFKSERTRHKLPLDYCRDCRCGIRRKLRTNSDLLLSTASSKRNLYLIIFSFCTPTDGDILLLCTLHRAIATLSWRLIVRPWFKALEITYSIEWRRLF